MSTQSERFEQIVRALAEGGEALDPTLDDAAKLRWYRGQAVAALGLSKTGAIAACEEGLQGLVNHFKIDPATVEPDQLENLRDTVEGIRAAAASAMSLPAPVSVTLRRIEEQAERALAMAESLMGSKS